MVDWGMGVTDPRAFYQGNDYVDRLYNMQAQKAAGAKVASGDLRGAAGDLGGRGDIAGALDLTNRAAVNAKAAKTEAQSDADRKALQFKSQHEYLQRAVPVLTKILQTAGPQKLMEAYGQLSQELQQMGIPPEAIAQYGQAFQRDPQGTLQTLAATAQKKFQFQKVGDDVLVLDEATGQEVTRFAAPPKAPVGPSQADLARDANNPFNADGSPNAAYQEYETNRARTLAQERREVIIQNPLPSNTAGAFRNLTPAETKERGYKPGTRAQINDVTGQVNVLQSPNDMDLKNAGYANRAIQANKRLDDLAASGITQPSAQVVISEVNGVTRIIASNQKDRQFIQASKEWLAPILRKDTGAAVTDTEFVYYSDIYIPRPEDGPEVLAQKKAARATAMESLRGESGPAYSDMFGERDAAERNAAPPPTQASAPTNAIHYDAQGNRVK